MEQKFVINTGKSQVQVVEVLKGVIKKPSFFRRSTSFEGKVEGNKINLETYDVPVININGEIEETSSGCKIYLKLISADTRTSLRLFLNTGFTLVICLISLFRIRASPESVSTYILILTLIIGGYILNKIALFFVFHLHVNQYPEGYINSIRKLVDGKIEKS